MTDRNRMLASIALAAASYPDLPPGADRMLSLKETLAIVGLSKVTVWKRIQAGDFPHARELGAPGRKNRKVGFLLSEILAWIRDRPPSLLKADKVAIAAEQKASAGRKTTPRNKGRRLVTA
jgi:predicted DNA-binding transcriptional regulator AlpA